MSSSYSQLSSLPDIHSILVYCSSSVVSTSIYFLSSLSYLSVPVSGFAWLLCAPAFLPHPLRASCGFLRPLTFLYPRIASYFRYSNRCRYCHPSSLCRQCFVSVLCHSILAFGFSLARNCFPSRSTLLTADHVQSYFAALPLELNPRLIVLYLGTPSITTTGTVPSQSFVVHPPCLTVPRLLLSDIISSLVVFICVVGSI